MKNKAVIAILSGIMIYLLLRSRNLILYRWIGVTFTSAPPLFYKNANNNIFAGFLIYSMPDGLWLYSFIMMLACVWGDEGKRVKYMIALGLLSIALINEAGQYFHIFIGTFDIGDIVAYVIAAISAIYSMKNYRGNKNEQKN